MIASMTAIIRPGLSEERAVRKSCNGIIEEGEVGAEVQIRAKGVQDESQSKLPALGYAVPYVPSATSC